MFWNNRRKDRERRLYSGVVNDFNKKMQEMNMKLVSPGHYQCTASNFGKLRVRDFSFSYTVSLSKDFYKQLSIMTKFLHLLANTQIPNTIDLSINVHVKWNEIFVQYKLFLPGARKPFIEIKEVLYAGRNISNISEIRPPGTITWFYVELPVVVTADYSQIRGISKDIVKKALITLFKNTHHTKYTTVTMIALTALELSNILKTVVSIEFGNNIVMVKPKNIVMFSSGGNILKCFQNMSESEQEKLLLSIINTVKRQVSH